MAALTDIGIALAVDPTGGTTWNTLGNVIEAISGPEAKADMVEITPLGASEKTFAKAQLDRGKVSFTILYDPADTTDSTIMVDMFDQRTVAAWKITYADATTETFKGFVETLGREIKTGDKVSQKIGIQLQGGQGAGYA